MAGNSVTCAHLQLILLEPLTDIREPHLGLYQAAIVFSLTDQTVYLSQTSNRDQR